MNVLIVDDEPITRVALRTFIDWDESGFNLIGEASNGAEALDILAQERTDILVTDLRMPVMDGLELIRRTRELTDDIMVVVLSCLDDFHSVREAMMLGVGDYILKPTMEPDQFVEVLKSAAAKLQEERTRKEQFAQWQSDIRQSMQAQLGWKVRQYLDGRMPDEEIQHALFAEHKVLSSFMIFTCPTTSSVDPMEEFYNDAVAYIHWADGRIFLLYEGEEGVVSELKRHRIALDQAKILAAVFTKGEQGDDWVIGIGPTVRQAVDLRNLPLFFDHQLYQRFYYDRKVNIIDRSLKFDQDTLSQPEDLLPLELRNQLMRAINGNNAEAILENARRITETIKHTKPPIAKVQSFVFEVAVMAAAQANDRSHFDLRAFEHRYLALERVQAHLHIDDLLAWFNECIKQLGNELAGIHSQADSSNPFIRKAIRYMNQHYASPISTTDIAEHVQLSRSYFSDLYSKEMGISLSESLNHIRIEAAKKKLKTGQYKVYEIAEKVGFTDAKSFAKVFKKTVGFTPRAYTEANK